jgi:SAM-dependent methyltransferase
VSVSNVDDTAARSLAHWSEAGRAEMDAFYALARLDYEQLAKAVDWNAALRACAGRAGDADRLALLDVACGSGKFPEALERHADLAGVPPVVCDLLDPSAFSLAEAARALRPPLRAAAAHESTLEDLDPALGPWDVVWATHALYALPPAALARGAARLAAALAPHGLGFLAQGTVRGHYLEVYRRFLDGVRGGRGTPYLGGEDVAAALRDSLAGSPIAVHERLLHYDHVVAEADEAVLEGYLQRCLFDDSLPLAAMRAAPGLGPYLASCHDAAAGAYRFHQEVLCVLLLPDGVPPPWTAGS